MKHSLELSAATSPAWADTVMASFSSFLQDHADCERKASAMALSLVAKYPDRVEIIPELIATGLEELEHFQQVYQHMAKRGIRLAKEIAEDPYIKQLLNLCYSDPLRRFLDRLLLGSIIECRGAERFRLIWDRLSADDELKAFYHELWTSEAKHGDIYVRLALIYFPEADVYRRLRELNDAEGKIIQNLPLRAALH